MNRIEKLPGLPAGHGAREGRVHIGTIALATGAVSRVASLLSAASASASG
jgi:hypothetical protein